MDVAAATTLSLTEFQGALSRVVFSIAQKVAIVDASGGHNIAMLGLLAGELISRLCCWIETYTVNPLAITTIQQQLLLVMHYWVTAPTT